MVDQESRWCRLYEPSGKVDGVITALQARKQGLPFRVTIQSPSSFHSTPEMPTFGTPVGPFPSSVPETVVVMTPPSGLATGTLMGLASTFSTATNQVSGLRRAACTESESHTCTCPARQRPLSKLRHPHSQSAQLQPTKKQQASIPTNPQSVRVHHIHRAPNASPAIPKRASGHPTGDRSDASKASMTKHIGHRENMRGPQN